MNTDNHMSRMGSSEPRGYGAVGDARKSARHATCLAIVAEFVFGPEWCGEPAPHTVNADGADWPVCPEHFAAFNAEASDE